MRTWHGHPWSIVAGLSGFLAVVMGAVGAHAVTDAHAAELVVKASNYQLIHTAVILLMPDSNRALKCGRWLLAIGVVLFCGALYLKGLFDWGEIIRLAPFGGCSLMLGWLAIALGGIKKS